MVRQFHEAFGVPAYDTPRIPPPVRQTLRRSLIEEEWWETYHALMGASVGTNDIAEIADGLADLVVVIYGTALEYGIDLDAVLEEVHRSNMAKLGADGKPICREDGKILKPKGWQSPNIARILTRQELLADAKKWWDALPPCACSDYCHGSDAEHRCKTAPK